MRKNHLFHQFSLVNLLSFAHWTGVLRDVLREASRCSELTAVLAREKGLGNVVVGLHPSPVFDLAQTLHVPSNMARASASNTKNFFRYLSCSKSRLAVTRLLRIR